MLLVTEVLPIDASEGVVKLESKWNFPGLALRWLYANQWKVCLKWPVTCMR